MRHRWPDLEHLCAHNRKMIPLKREGESWKQRAPRGVCFTRKPLLLSAEGPQRGQEIPAAAAMAACARGGLCHPACSEVLLSGSVLEQMIPLLQLWGLILTPECFETPWRWW